MPGTAFAAGHNPELVSVNNDGKRMNHVNFMDQVSDDGNVVTFATLTYPGEETYRATYYVRDRKAGTTTKLFADEGSLDEDGSPLALSGNGRYVVFYRYHGDGAPDDWIKYDVKTHKSKRFDGPNFYTSALSVSDDGRTVAAKQGSNPKQRVAIVNTDTGASHTVLSGGEYEDMNLSGDGSTLAYTKYTDTVDGNVLDAAYKLHLGGKPERVDVRADGTAPSDGDMSTIRGLSDNGRFVLFEERTGAGIASVCDPQTGPDEFHPDVCVFRRDTVKDRTTVVNKDTAGKVYRAVGFGSSVSDDGNRVLFIDALDGQKHAQLQVRDIAKGTTRTIGRNAKGDLPDEGPNEAMLSGNGKSVAVTSEATNYGAPTPKDDARNVYAVPVSN